MYTSTFTVIRGGPKSIFLLALLLAFGYCLGQRILSCIIVVDSDRWSLTMRIE